MPDPVEAPVRKLIYELLVQLRRKKAVARALNEAGYRTRDGAEWSDTSIDRLVRDPTAMGFYRSAPDMQVQAIVSQELWKECNAYLDSDDLGGRRGRQAIHLFAGFLLCHCGRRMYVRTHSHDYHCSACRNRIAAADLEAIFVEQIRDYPLPTTTTAGETHELQQYWPSLKPGEKRRIIEGLVERIVIGQDDIDITLCAPPAPAPAGAQGPPSPLAEGPRDGSPRADPNEAAAAPSVNGAAKEQKVDPIALAIALMKDHPEWSARKLAAAAGCAHTTLTRSPLFRTAKSLATAKRSPPQGWRLPDGRIEARGDGEDDAGGS